MKEYEIVYIFDSALEESAITEKLERYHALIAGEGAGEIAALDEWGRRQLAYPIEDRENGYYVVVHASTTADRLPEFERLLQLDEQLLRYLIVVNEGNLPTSPAPIVESSDEDEDSDDEEA